MFWKSIKTIQEKAGFELIAWVILPEHFHLLINPEEQIISNIMQRIKLSFSVEYSKKHPHVNRIWQRSFWDHIIRDEDDFYRHLNYIHLNPVKHGLVKNPFEYPHSSIMKFKDYYADGWGVEDEDEPEGEFGE